MNRKLLELAFDRLRASDWEYFEEISSSFLASDFPALRTMANPSGDGGRDSELFSPEGKNTISIQYSVTESWEPKIKKTLDRILETLTEVRVLIYMSNQIIGAKADKIKARCLENGVMLDVRDRNWFLERFEVDDAKYGASTELVNTIAKPFLESEEIIQRRRPALSSTESKAALTYLGLQWEDETTDKGLTKIVYESLVRAALRNTNSDSRITREELLGRIFTYIPSTISDEAEKNVNSALIRLSKKVIKHWPNEDEFCLSHEESQRIQQKLTESECEEVEFSNDVRKLLENEVDEIDGINDAIIPSLAERIVRIIDVFLVKSGESFASSVSNGDVYLNDTSLLKTVIFEDINQNPGDMEGLASFPDIALNVIARVLVSSNPSIKTHLKKISDTYTLFSFLKETPDIQKATKKIFGHAKIWLDTTIVLPLLVDSLKSEKEDRKYTDIICSLRDSGVEMRVTEGVINELLYHIRKSVHCSNYKPSDWIGRVPYLYYHYIEQGYSPNRFSETVEVFRGESRPEEDIAEFLSINYGVQVESLENSASLIDKSIRFPIERLWREAHENRRSNADGTNNVDSSVTDALIRHDVESYLGILGLRKNETVSELGYKHWWLTIDSLAWRIRNTIKEEFENPPMSPLISLDFLSNTLSFGPARSTIDRTHEQLLPQFLDIDLADHMPPELIEIADRVREENSGLPEHIISRKVRDACDRMRRRYGTMTKKAVEAEQGAAHG